jgi:glycosyltransferase involved in cell wall biosynthesis
MGVFETRNRLLDAARGKYILLCDSDDWMDDNCLEVLAGAALKSDADRVIAQFRDVNEEGKTIQYQDLPEHPSKWICGVHHGTMYRRSIFIDNNIRFKEVYPDDVYINVLYNQHVNRVEFVHKTIYNWFVHTNSQSRAQKKNSPWQGSRLFDSSCSFLIPVLDKMKENNDKETADLELMLIKLYTLSFYCAYGRPFADFLREYDKIRATMMKYDPDYKKNPYLKLSSDSPMRDYATKIVRMTVILEKLHLIKPALIGYKIVSKFHYFDL